MALFAMRIATVTCAMAPACGPRGLADDGGADDGGAEDGGMDSSVQLDAPSAPDCPWLALDAPLGTLRCGTTVCGADEACCLLGLDRGCADTQCLPRAPDYPISCLTVSECDVLGGGCGDGEGCCAMGGGTRRCALLADGCTAAWVCSTSPGGGHCPSGEHCALTDLEGGMGCTNDEIDGGLDAP